MFNNQNGNTQQQTPTNQTPSSNTHTTTETPNNPPTTQAPTTTQQPTTQTPATTQASSGHWERKWIVDSPAWDEEIPIYEDKCRMICTGCGGYLYSRDEYINHPCVASYYDDYYQVYVGTQTYHHDEQGHWEEVWVED